MARPRHSLTCLAALLLAACGPAPAPPPVPVPPAPSPSAPAPATPTPGLVQVAPSWQSRVPEITPDEIEATLERARRARDRGQLERARSPGPGALELYLAVLAIAPDNAQAQQGVQSVLDALLEQGRLAMRAGNLASAERTELITQSLLPAHPDLAVYREHLGKAREAARLLARANAAAKAGRITRPTDDSALHYFNRVEATFPEFEPLAVDREHWNRALLEQAWKAAGKEAFAKASMLLDESRRLAPGNRDLRVMELRIIELRQARTRDLLARGNRDVDRLRLDAADANRAHAARIAPQSAGVDALRHRIHIARHYGPFQPREVFAEKIGKGAAAPAMVVIPYGQFLMGSSPGDAGHNANEAPRHPVTFARGFAISRNEVTVGDFRRFVEATGYRTQATRAGRSTVYDEKGGVFSEHAGVDWRRDHVGRPASASLPVVHVSLADAVAYTRWLSSRTGERYRLPSEAEFEYVLRAGSTTVYPWGNSPPRKLVGNLTGDGDLSRVGRRWGNAIPGYRDAFWGPAPVRNFPVEGFGTFDMIGNVSEWTLDCWHESYQRAPLDGSAWVNPGCRDNVVRGASWGSALDQARSASRLPMKAGTTSARLGFRVVREI